MIKIKNVIIRNLTDDDREAIQIAMDETGKHQASKALLTICRAYGRIVTQLKHTMEENTRLKNENKQLRKCANIILGMQNEVKRLCEQETTECQKEKIDECRCSIL